MSVSELCALMEGAHEQYEALDESEADRLGALLYDAARCGRLEEARELLVQGADPSWRNPYMQRTPLHTVRWFVRQQQQRFELPPPRSCET